MDWASRRVLAWRLSNTLDTEFCLEALAEALERYEIPDIFNTDQGSQFTSIAFTGLLEAAGIRCSMDGRGRFLDNVFIERLWRSLKYEAVYLHELADGFVAQRVIDEWIEFYNEVRPHSALGGRTPAEAYRGARHPDSRWRSGHGEQVATAGYEAGGASRCPIGRGELSTYPQDQAPGPPPPDPRPPLPPPDLQREGWDDNQRNTLNLPLELSNPPGPPQITLDDIRACLAYAAEREQRTKRIPAAAGTGTTVHARHEG